MVRNRVVIVTTTKIYPKTLVEKCSGYNLLPLDKVKHIYIKLWFELIEDIEQSKRHLC